MLVLSRQRDETIMIGHGIQITVVDIRGDKVRLGVLAPKEIPVHRKEVYDAIVRETKAEKQDISSDQRVIDTALKEIETLLPTVTTLGQLLSIVQKLKGKL